VLHPEPLTRPHLTRPSLPERPSLPDWVPVLRRGKHDLQVGLDPQAGLILSGAPHGLQEVLGLLDGVRTLDQIAALAADRDVDADLLGQVLRSLDAAGLLRPVRPARERLRIRLLGAGVLGRAIATALIDARIGQLLLVDGDPVDSRVYPRAGLAASQADALRAYLVAPPQDRGQGRPDDRTEIRVVRHWTKPESPPPDLTVIAAATAEPDRAIGADYVRDDHPHLYVRPMLGGAVVGPYVRPGRSPCLGCLDQVRTDADQAWPELLAQLCQKPMPVDPLLAGWAATTAATQVLTAMAGGSPATLAGTCELTAADGDLVYRQWPMHSNCGCAWYG
jgi:hypothetical protein